MTPRAPSYMTYRRIAFWHLVLLGLQTPLGAYAAAYDVNEPDTALTSATSQETPRTLSNAAQPAATLAPQSAADEQADRLFREGLELMHADRCSEAIKRFSSSERLSSSAATLMNLAICHEHMNKPATAWRIFVRAVDTATAEGHTELRTQAAEALSKLGPVLTRIRIVTALTVEGQVIKLNGERLSDYRESIPVDPGEYVIEVSAPGRKAWRAKVLAKGVGTIHVEVPTLAPDVAPQSPVEHRADLRPAAIVAGGLGVVGLTIGAIWAVRAGAANDSATEHGRCTASYCDPVGHEWRDTAWDRARVATWATSFGLIAIATGTVLWVTSPSHKAEQRATQRAEQRLGVTPWLDAKSSGGGLLVGGRL